jgi:hypothetical protein
MSMSMSMGMNGREYEYKDNNFSQSNLWIFQCPCPRSLLGVCSQTKNHNQKDLLLVYLRILLFFYSQSRFLFLFCVVKKG